MVPPASKRLLFLSKYEAPSLYSKLINPSFILKLCTLRRVLSIIDKPWLVVIQRLPAKS